MNNYSPTLDIPQAVCTCGNELGMLYYLSNAESSFEDFMLTIVGEDCDIDDDITNMGFVKDFIAEAGKRELIACCWRSINFAIVAPIPIAITVTDSKTTRRYPTAIDGPVKSLKALTWY